MNTDESKAVTRADKSIECYHCGARVADDATECPYCGQSPGMHTSCPDASPDVPAPVATQSTSAPRRGCGWAMFAGMVAGATLLAVAALAILAVYQGTQERTRLNRAAAADHYQRGLDQLAMKNYDLAAAEFEMVLQLDPQNRDSAARLAEVNTLLDQRPTPTSAQRYYAAGVAYNAARELYNQKDWQGALAKLEEVRSLAPDYDAEQVTTLLADSYYRAALGLVEQNRLEEAIRYLDYSLALKSPNELAAEQRRLAALYLSGLGYWGANWQAAIESFRVLQQLQPDYLDTQQRLHDAYLEYADALSSRSDWCSARDHYDSALALAADDMTRSKREEAARNCVVPPAPPPTPPPAGTYVGTVVRVEDVGRKEAMMIRGRILDALGRPVVGTRVGLSAWDWTAAPALSNEEGVFAFDGLGNPVTYNVTLLDLPSVSLPAKADWSKLVWVEFRPQP